MIKILALFLTTVFAQQDKYIELIPDEKQQEFIEKIATRIMESVESNVTNIHNRELTDKQLNAHNSYVQNILKQEAVPFEAQRHQRHDQKSEDRDKINNVDKSSLDSETIQSTTKIQDIKIEYITNTLSSVLKNDSLYENVSEPNMSLSVTATNFIQEDDNITTETTTGSKSQIIEYDTAKKSDIIYLTTKSDDNQKYLVQDFESCSNGSESYRQDPSACTVNSSLGDESTTDSVINKTTYENAELPTTLNSQEFTTTTQNTAEVNIATTENYSVVKEDRSEKKRLPTVTETAIFTRILTTINIEEKQSTKKNKKNKLRNTMTQPNSDNLVQYVASKVMKKHRHELNKQEKFIDTIIETTNKGNTNLNYYRVYEIPRPTKSNIQPSHKSQEPIKDQTYFVPVYKYSPKFAYYNPQNRLGPNEVEENTIELDQQLREGNNDLNYKKEPSEFVLQLNNELRKFGKLKRKKTTTTELPFPTQTVVEEVKMIDNELEKRKQIFQTLINFSLQFIKNFLKPYTNTYPAESNGSCESRDNESSDCKTFNEGWNDSQDKGRIINKTPKTTEKKDYYSILKKLQSFNYPLIRSKAESKVNINMKVLKDLILNDTKSLKLYDDQLSTTKQVLKALSEIYNLIKRMRQSEQLSPADFKLLRYMVYLHNLSLKEKKGNKKRSNKLKKKVQLSPKSTRLKSSADTTVNSHVFTAITENYNAVTQYLLAKKHLQVIKKTKHETKLKKKEKIIDNEIETTSKRNTHGNSYQVFDIPWPFERVNQPFFRSQDTINDQHYFVPIHKYSPIFASYNPKNRLGPNKVEANSKELDTYVRERNNDIHDKAEPSEFMLQLNDEMRMFMNLFKKRTKRSTTTLAPRNISYKSCDICESTNKETSNEAWNRAEILSATNKKNISQALDLPLMRSKVKSRVTIYTNVLKDLILEDNKSLKQYDWLTTTVQIQSALSKIINLIKRMRQSKKLHPDDLQILRYIIFLHNFSLEAKKESIKLSNMLRKRVKFFPKKLKLLKEKGLINKAWPYLRTPQLDLGEDDELGHLYEFLIDVQDRLFDLHEAIKHIADVTKFDRQNWYGNLKQLYLRRVNEKHLRELLLHISMSRLVDLVEHSCNYILDHDFIQFVKTNNKNAKRIVEEFIFINDIVHDITINKG